MLCNAIADILYHFFLFERFLAEISSCWGAARGKHKTIRISNSILDHHKSATFATFFSLSTFLNDRYFFFPLNQKSVTLIRQKNQTIASLSRHMKRKTKTYAATYTNSLTYYSTCSVNWFIFTKLCCSLTYSIFLTSTLSNTNENKNETLCFHREYKVYTHIRQRHTNTHTFCSALIFYFALSFRLEIFFRSVFFFCSRRENAYFSWRAQVTSKPRQTSQMKCNCTLQNFNFLSSSVRKKVFTTKMHTLNCSFHCAALKHRTQLAST